MNILVSGGSGYIGSFLVKRLIENGDTVGIIARKENEYTRLNHDQVNIYSADITKPFDFVPQVKYDLFVHLAAANDIDSTDPAYAINASALGTRYALEFCKKNAIKKFIYYSTFQVYGRVEGEMDENSVVFPGNDYGITHLFAEQYVQMYQRIAAIDYIILRPTNIFGAPMFKNTDRWTLVPSCFCKEAVEKGEINLMSSGKQNRDFLDVNDLAAITELYCLQFESFKNATVNIASGNHFTIHEIASTVAKIYEQQFGKPCRINIHSEQPRSENVFCINRHEVNKTGFLFGNKSVIETEIRKIFRLLN
jgi:UDP-glucose 4-epimerase